jgi:hypothetical protein
MKKSLPLFPTGKEHVSYSEIVDWVECSFRHKLKHIDKIDLGSGSNIHSEFGQIIHDAAEQYLKTRALPATKDCLTEFKTKLKALDEETQEKALKILPEFIKNFSDMVKQIPEWLNEKFPNWELVDAEHLILENIEKSSIDGFKFKGYLDGIIKYKKEPTKKLLKEYKKLHGADSLPPDQYEYVIIDWKACSWGWKIEQKRSFEKQMQLVFYKHFFAKKMNIPLNQIKCGFVLIKRTVPKVRRTCDRIEFIPISVGPVVTERALSVLQNMINQVKAGRTVKNRKYCKPFCPYNGTKHCP